MKKYLLLFLISAMSYGQNDDATCVLLSKINTVFQTKHYSPKKLNDSLSVYIFDNFIDEIDNNHALFTKSEYQNLSKKRLLIDDAIINKDCSFFDELVSSYTTALERKKGIIQRIEQTTLNYNGVDTIRFSKKAFDFDTNESVLEHIWNKRIRYEILDDIASQSKNLDSLKQNFTALENIARKKVFETEYCKIESTLNSKNGVAGDLKSVLLNLFCTYFDPHSSYFSYDDKSSFMSTLSSNNLSLGINVTINNKEEIIIDEVIPGGPAAKTEKFEKGDVITKVATISGESYSSSCGALEKIGTLVFSDTYKELLITLHKKNGKVIDVKVQKKLMEDVENTIESFIIENGIRVGYIKIPSFYSNFEGGTNRSCANDFEKELKKLKKENIEGLIIDLEDNGGGSMEETEALSSMFINSGPISIFSDNKRNLEILKDSNKGSIYNGPIVILANGNSASASEFFISVMQDYNKAIVIGSNTFGKATIQTIQPLEAKNNDNFVKVTIGKFYRVTGKSHQKIGITPDVALPILFDNLIERESKSKTALVNDSIPINLNINVEPRKNMGRAIALSKKRVENSERFNEIKKLNTQIDNVLNKDHKFLKIDLESVFNLWHETDDTYQRIKNAAEEEISCQVINTSYREKEITKDEYKKEINDFNIKSVKSNPLIEEGLNIIKDIK